MSATSRYLQGQWICSTGWNGDEFYENYRTAYCNANSLISNANVYASLNLSYSNIHEHNPNAHNHPLTYM